MTDDIIRKLYYDPQQGFSSVKKLYEKLKSQNITQKQIKEFLSKQEVNQLHHTIKEPKNYVPIMSYYPNEMIQLILWIYQIYQQQIHISSTFYVE